MEKLYRMNDASKILGVSIKTLQRWDKQGIITCERTPGGRRRVSESEINRLMSSKERTVAIYGRVSNDEGTLERQISWIKEQLPIKEYAQVLILRDIAEATDEKRKGLLELMELARMGSITDLAIRDKDSLASPGFEYLKQYFLSHNVRLHILV
ncbi:MerR family DNA-binding transcriptional regulator [Priestia filamentosa]|uniref:IS607 family transposase n=1 Tax=Priestia filamentosa TaxID=1402861 RepID=UPI003981E563